MWRPSGWPPFTSGKRSKEWHYEKSYVLDNSPKLVFQCLLTYFSGEGVPLNPVCLNKATRECLDLIGRHGCITVLERCADGLEKRIHRELEMSRAHPHVIEVLHSTVGTTE